MLPVTGDGWAAWLLALARPEIPRDPPPGVWTALTWLARRDGYTVTRTTTGPAGSYTDWDTRRILIRSDLPQRDATRALLHELGHVLAEAVTIAWYVVASAALALICVAMRDRWHRYSRHFHRLSSPGPAPRRTNERVSATGSGRQG